MLFYILNFFAIIALLSTLNILVHYVNNMLKFRSDNVSLIDSGRILDFETDKSESQEKPVFTC